MTAFMHDNAYLIAVVVLGFGWVIFKVFTHEQAAEKDRDEASLDIL